LTAINGDNKVALVTNASLEWVYLSSNILLPKTAAIMQGRVHVISARVDGLDLPSDQWKINCFMILFEELQLDVNQVTNLIVVGDSMNEITAGMQLKKRLHQCVLKLVKMQEKPTLKALIK
jgi:hypothetical protein